MAYRTPIDNNDKKEKILYRVVRIVMTLAMVLIVGYMVTHVGENTSQSVTANSPKTEAVAENTTETKTETTADTEAIAETAADTEAIVESTGNTETEADPTSNTTAITSDTVENTEESIDENTDENNETLTTAEDVSIIYTFRNDKLLSSHYEKHGIDMGFSSAKEYEKAASDVINNPSALHKTEAEDGDYVYYVEATNEFVVLSTDGYIRTYFNPDAGIKYYNKQ